VFFSKFFSQLWSVCGSFGQRLKGKITGGNDTFRFWPCVHGRVPFL